MSFAGIGSLTVWLNDTSRQASFIRTAYHDSAIVLATLQEPLIEKDKSYKAEATVQLFENGQLQNVKGNIIIYLQKDSINRILPLTYGSRIIFKKPLQPIRNAGNPGGFDYQRYCAFHGLYYQIFLKREDYEITQQKAISSFRQILFQLQQWIIQSFKRLIPGDKESGVAEALLIGYKNDLDADLVKRYSNTGVVHIIAISGMHLGLIYGLLVLLFSPLKNSKKLIYVRGIVIIASLWIFSLLTGAAPSIVRSAIMFTFLVLGDMQQRKSSIYNSLALSALLILLYDPFSLWDVGFQLSYTAILSIAVFAKPISNWFCFSNKWAQKIWQLNAVTLAAQILTYPIIAYHFHQFPNLFLLTNFVAVPLSSLILYILLFLLLISPISYIGIIVGKIAAWLIWVMNTLIEKLGASSFALTDNIYYTMPQVITLFGLISVLSWWLIYKSSRAFIYTLFLFSIFITLRTFQFIQNTSQQKLVIYNVPQHAAIDIIKGKGYVFIGDSTLSQNDILQNFYIKPSRILYQVHQKDRLNNVLITDKALLLGKKKMMITSSGIVPSNTGTITPDVLLITGNPKLKLPDLILSVHPKIIIADGTNSRGKISLWQKEAEHLHLQFHSVANDGAFVLDW